jgi:N6-adenosine-specific RNA methylase IME4
MFHFLNRVELGRPHGTPANPLLLVDWPTRSEAESMTEKSTLTLDLRQQLDEIDKRVVGEVYDGFYESRLRVEFGIWEKGKKVSDFRGVNSEVSYAELKRVTGRDDKSLKAWCDLYEKYPNRETFLDEYAKPKAKAWTEKALQAKPLLTAVETPALPTGQFTVIYADPPWQYEHPISESRAIESHYPTMQLEEIKAMKIPIAENAVIFLWAPAPKLTEALEVMTAWGFSYRTNAVWDKEKIGMGYWFRGQHEHLLLGVKGEVAPPVDSERVSSVIRFPRTEHSRKPSVVAELIDRWFPGQEKIELFARGKPRDGWVGWGLDAN